MTLQIKYPDFVTPEEVPIALFRQMNCGNVHGLATAKLLDSILQPTKIVLRHPGYCKVGWQEHIVDVDLRLHFSVYLDPAMRWNSRLRSDSWSK